MLANLQERCQRQRCELHQIHYNSVVVRYSVGSVVRETRNAVAEFQTLFLASGWRKVET